MNESAVISNVKSLADAKRILSEAATRSEDIEAVRGLLKDIQQLLPVDEDDECDCGAEDPEDCTCEEDAEDETAAKSILQELCFELKGQGGRSRLRW